MEHNKLSAAVHNLGCKVNAYEADAMVQELRSAGVQIVDWDAAPADIYIINTCSVTNMADRKSRQMLHKARAMNPQAIVIAAGCYVQARAAELSADAAVDILIGNQEKGQLLSILEQYWDAHPEKRPAAPVRMPETMHRGENDGREEPDRDFVTEQHTSAPAACFVSDLSRPQSYAPLWAGEIADQGRAFIKVQDGCNQFCSYCIIPYVRGRIRSRSVEDTVREVTDFARRGYHEVVLTGIHLSSYGLDFAHTNYEYAMEHALPSEWLLQLIRNVAAVPGIQRVRLGSLEPRIITDAFVEALRKIPALCPHFHLSLQSGSDRILRAMNRHYDTAAFRQAAGLLRAAWEDAAITTDVIVGFPGEREEDFLETCRFAEEIGFYEMHVFKYSRRQGTAADRMPDQISEQEKARRSEKLIRIGEGMSEAFRRRFLGRTEEVIPEELVELRGEHYLRGYSRSYVRYLVPADGISQPDCKIGQIIKVDGCEICGGCVLALPM